KIHLTRYAKGTVELTATDGWNGISRDVVGLVGQTVKIENPYPVQIRKLCDGRWFPDVPKGFQVAWSLEGRRVKPERDQTVSLPSDARGVLRLEATRAAAVDVVGERAVEEGGWMGSFWILVTGHESERQFDSQRRARSDRDEGKRPHPGNRSPDPRRARAPGRLRPAHPRAG